MSEIDRLLGIMRKLRSPEGCPWDREQTVETLKPYAVEEVYEVIDAIDRGDMADHCEELGDLLLQVVFQSQLREEDGIFNFEDVAKSISDKLVRRHPHVFGEVDVADAAEVLVNWNAIKETEKAGRKADDSVLDKVPKHLPALLKAHDLQKQAAKVGFDWPEVGQVLDKVEEEVQELREAIANGDQAHAREELGDLLFALANVGRHLDGNAEQILQDGNQKFQQRFRAVEAQVKARGKEMSDCSLAELDAVWDEVKRG
ncbi:nucleoside triphosphate pyrophosphohydrolase [Kiritimatiellaeota bacterium B1221]|nr:nucleoside triphosphate pyrophosphohydrolase [Kiritimatiellaeota bacterium B1221]